MSPAKEAIRANLPIVATAYRALRQVAGLNGNKSRKYLNRYIQQQTGSTVVSGPFAGMKIEEGASWGDGDIAPKLLGTYEQELHETLEEFRRRSYDAVVDLGCAEGYYAVGLARLFPALTVYAFDTNKAALRIARRTAESNGVANRIVFDGFCDWQRLSQLAAHHCRLLILSDCEGYEVDLFGSGDRQALSRSDLIIECHDKIRPHGTEAMTDALSHTHRVRCLGAIGRNPNQFSFMTEIHESDRWLAICENRPYCSHWLACESLTPS